MFNYFHHFDMCSPLFICVHFCSSVFTCVHLCSPVFICVHLCSHVWCFRPDRSALSSDKLDNGWDLRSLPFLRTRTVPLNSMDCPTVLVRARKEQLIVVSSLYVEFIVSKTLSRNNSDIRQERGILIIWKRFYDASTVGWIQLWFLQKAMLDSLYK